MSLKGQYLLCNGCGDDTHLLKKPVPTPHGLFSKLRAIYTVVRPGIITTLPGFS